MCRGTASLAVRISSALQQRKPCDPCALRARSYASDRPGSDRTGRRHGRTVCAADEIRATLVLEELLRHRIPDDSPASALTACFADRTAFRQRLLVRRFHLTSSGDSL